MIDFTEFLKHLKNLLIHILIFPYWYISIYVFHDDFYKSADSILLVALSTCLTITSGLIASLASPGDKFILDLNVVRSSTAIQIGWFSLLLIVSYVSKIEYNIVFKFHGFVIAYFSPLLIGFLFIALTDKEKDKSKEEHKAKTKKKLSKTK